MNAVFAPDRTVEDYESYPVVITRWKSISHERFQWIKEHPGYDLTRMVADPETDKPDLAVARGVMLLDESSQDGILVKYDGFSPTKSAAFIPSARVLYRDHLMTVAERDLRGLISSASHSMAADAAAGKTRFKMSKYIDLKIVAACVREAIIERLNNRDDIISAVDTFNEGDKTPTVIIKAAPPKPLSYDDEEDDDENTALEIHYEDS